MAQGFRVGAFIFLALLVAGCGAEEKKARASAVVEHYFQAVKTNDPDRAMTFFAKRFFETRSPAGWKADFRLITARLGPLQSYSRRGWNWRTDFVPPASGTEVTLEYEVRYAKHPAIETFVVHKPFTRNEYQIVNHSIASEGLLTQPAR